MKQLIVRLGSMGDVIHTLPAAATLKHSTPSCHLAWIVDPRWAPLLEGNPYIDEIIPFSRKQLRSVIGIRGELRRRRFDTVVDFQGLFKSALLASLARPDRIIGFHQAQARESLAALFYSTRVMAHSAHVVDRNLELAEAAGATNLVRTFPLPPGKPEGRLPENPFVLASPLGGWRGKQWPLEHYNQLAAMLQQGGLTLVLNGPPDANFDSVPQAWPHYSGLEGLIHATGRATAVLGIDSGPMHLAAAMEKPGVAIFGPTDPARNGPYGGSFTVIRSPSARTTYKRRSEIDVSMQEISAGMVFEALLARLGAASRSAGCGR